MEVSVKPSRVAGSLVANASKSAMQRACAAALLRQGKSVIVNPGISNDDIAALDIIQKLGAAVSTEPNGNLLIDSKGVVPISDTIHCGESGLSIRMFTPIAALSQQEITITGEGSLSVRPMNFFDEILPKLGVKVQSVAGKLPLCIQGPLRPIDIEIDGSLSSQFLTGLLMAYSAAGASGVTIIVRDLKSRPYIDLTLQLLQAFGLKTPINNSFQSFSYSASDVSVPDSITYTVEGDWSGAAFLLVAGAVAGELRVSGIYNNSRQADKKIIDAIRDAGAEVQVNSDAVFVKKMQLNAFAFDATDCPDLFPPLVALAANCHGNTTIIGLRRLKHKESDRGETLKAEFAKLGVQIALNDDEMVIHGTGKITVNDSRLNSHHDHRIAMAAAVAGLNANAAITIDHAEAIDKSYPQFYEHLRLLGVQVEAL